MTSTAHYSNQPLNKGDANVSFEVNFGPNDNIARESFPTREAAEAQIYRDADGEETVGGLLRVRENYRIVKVTTVRVYEEV